MECTTATRPRSAWRWGRKSASSQYRNCPRRRADTALTSALALAAATTDSGSFKPLSASKLFARLPASLRGKIPMSLTTPAARRDHSFHLHPATNLRALQKEGPLVITRGEGVYVYDDEGRRYLEGMAGLWCASLGFSERRLAEAAYRQMRELPFYHSFAGKVPAISTELAERLIGMAPAAMGKVLFANSGSEANDTAIKLVWYINNALGRPQKKKIVSRHRGYHGVTIATASLTGLAFALDDFYLPIPRVLHTD